MNKRGIIFLGFILLGISFLSSMLTSEAIKPYTTTPEECNDGCLVSDKCIGIGQRLMINDTKYYCNQEENITLQKDLGIDCVENYECITLLCGNNKCIKIEKEEITKIEKTYLQKILEKIKKIFFSLKPTL